MNPVLDHEGRKATGVRPTPPALDAKPMPMTLREARATAADGARPARRRQSPGRSRRAALSDFDVTRRAMGGSEQEHGPGAPRSIRLESAEEVEERESLEDEPEVASLETEGERGRRVSGGPGRRGGGDRPAPHRGGRRARPAAHRAPITSASISDPQRRPTPRCRERASPARRCGRPSSGRRFSGSRCRAR